MSTMEDIAGSSVPLDTHGSYRNSSPFHLHASNLVWLTSAIKRIRQPCGGTDASTQLNDMGLAVHMEGSASVSYEMLAVLKSTSSDSDDELPNTDLIVHLYGEPHYVLDNEDNEVEYTRIVAVIDSQKRVQDGGAICVSGSDSSESVSRRGAKYSSLIPPRKVVVPTAVVDDIRTVFSDQEIPDSQCFADADLLKLADTALLLTSQWINNAGDIQVSSVTFVGAGSSGCTAHLMHMLSLNDSRWITCSVSIDASRCMSRRVADYVRLKTTNMFRIVNAKKSDGELYRRWLTSDAPRLSTELPPDLGTLDSWAHAGTEVDIKENIMRVCADGSSSGNSGSSDALALISALLLGICAIAGLLTLFVPDVVSVAESVGGKTKRVATMELGGRGTAVTILCIVGAVAGLLAADRLVSRTEDPDASVEELRISASNDTDNSYWRQLHEGLQSRLRCAPNPTFSSVTSSSGLLILALFLSLGTTFLTWFIPSGTASTSIQIGVLPTALLLVVFAFIHGRG